MSPLCCSLDDAIDIFDKFSKYIHGKIDRIGVFDNFYVVETLNAYAFLISLNDAPEPIDLGYALGFNTLPDFIKQYGLEKAEGYYVPLNTLVLLVAPKEKCLGELRIKIPRKERMMFADPLQESLYEILDTADAYIRYRGKIIGCFSVAAISPLAEIAIEELSKRFKAASFEAIDEKRISTSWRVRFEFGVKPLFINNAVLDLEKLEIDLANSYLKLDEEEEAVRSLLIGLKYQRKEILVKTISDESRGYGKIIAYDIPLVKGYAKIILTRNIGNAKKIEGVEDYATKVLLCLVSKQERIKKDSKEISCSKVKVKRSKIKKEFLRFLLKGLKERLAVKNVNEFKVSFKNVKGSGFILVRDNISILVFQH